MLDFLKKQFFDGWAGLVLVAVGAAGLRLLAFSKWDFAVGWDAYFYLVNLRAWVETGQMHSPEAALVYPFLRVIHSFSISYEWSIKLGSALLAGFFVFSVGVFSKKNAGPGAWLLPVAAAVFSPHLTWFAAQFPKNLLGAGLLVLAAAFFKSSWRWSVFLIGLGFFGHRLTFVLAVVWAGLFGLFSAEKTPEILLKKLLAGRQQRPRILLKFFLAGRQQRRWALVFGFLIAAFLLVLASKKMPGLLARADLDRLAGLFDFQKMQFAPRSFWRDLEAVGGAFSNWQKAELLMFVGLFGCGLFRLFFDRKTCPELGSPRLVSMQKSLVLLALGLLWPFLEWSATGLGLRLFGMFGLLGPLFFLLVFDAEKRSFWPAVLAFSMLGLSLFSTQNFDPRTVSPDFPTFEKVAARAAEKLQNQPVELVIAHNGLAEFFEFRTRHEAMPWQPEYPIDSAKLWRLATDLREPFLLQMLDNEDVMRCEKLSNGYFLMPDFVFQHLLKKARAAGEDENLNELLTWRNPHLERPAWLLAKKKNR